MAKRDRDTVLLELNHSVNESGQTAVPIMIAARGTVLRGALIAQDRFFAELVEGAPLMAALSPGTGLLGEGYAKDVGAHSERFLHLRGTRVDGDREGLVGLWRISLDAVDAWTLRSGAEASEQEDKGPFARLLGNP
ncbi:MAG TPA: hypothetical protein VGM79_15590 [Streptosporangiaceae bacterium]|jgi:hypothetical protein